MHRAAVEAGPDPATGTGSPRPGLAPARSGERIVSIDVLRGAAVLGILLMNVYAFALPWPAYANPLRGGGSGALDRATWWATHLLAEMKFMSVFSMLFGAGLALMAERAEARGVRFAGLHYRRMLWLLLFGALHAYLLWFGDILFWYAVCGAALYPLRRLRPAALGALGVALLAVSLLPGLGFGFLVVPEMRAEAEAARAAEREGEALSAEQRAAIEAWEAFEPPPEALDEEIAVYRDGYAGQLRHRAPLVLQFQTLFLVFFGFWRVTALMLFGVAAAKLGLLAARRSARFYAVSAIVGYGIGLPVVALGARGLLDHGFDIVYLNQGGMLPNYFASIPVAAGHVAVVMLVCRAGALPSVQRHLAAVGRTALTNYLMQTVICTSIFYGWGLGWFAHLGRFRLMGVVAAVWALQIVASRAWLERFRYGPAEWLWRSLSYRSRQPMRRARPEPGSA